MQQDDLATNDGNERVNAPTPGMASEQQLDCLPPEDRGVGGQHLGHHVRNRGTTTELSILQALAGVHVVASLLGRSRNKNAVSSGGSHGLPTLQHLGRRKHTG